MTHCSVLAHWYLCFGQLITHERVETGRLFRHPEAQQQAVPRPVLYDRRAALHCLPPKKNNLPRPDRKAPEQLVRAILGRELPNDPCMTNLLTLPRRREWLNYSEEARFICVQGAFFYCHPLPTTLAV